MLRKLNTPSAMTLTAAMAPLTVVGIEVLPWEDALVGAPGSVAVYVATSSGGDTLYVGSVCRPQLEDGVRRRLRAHGRSPISTLWAAVTVVRLPGITGTASVRRAEGRLATHLAPTLGTHWPRC